MKFIGTIYTEGGPAIVLPYSQLRLWDGNTDYRRAIDLSMDGYAALLRTVGGACPACIVRHESDGNFHVFSSHACILVLSEIYAEEGHELRHRLPPVEPWIRQKTPYMLEYFGGKTAVLDATIPGCEVHLEEPGCEHILYPVKLADYHSAAIVNVEYGDWEAVELFCKTATVSFSGIMLRKVRARRAAEG